MGGKSEPYLTAFALWGLKLASDAGHKLSARHDRSRRRTTCARSWGATRPSPAASHSELGELGSRAFAVHVLGDVATSPDPGYANKLLEKKAELPRFGQAFLARALALNLGAQHPAVTGLLDDVAPRAVTTGTTAVIREPGRRQAALVHERRHAHDGDRDRRVPGPAAVGADAAAAGQGTVRRSGRTGAGRRRRTTSTSSSRSRTT